MPNTASTAVLVFENVEFDVVDIHGVPWLRGPQIGGALGYNRDDRIADLYARNADEFTAEMTQLVDLETAGGRQQVRILSPRGCYLLPRDPASMPMHERRAYLRDLWNADIDPFLFVGTARRLGYVLGCMWDGDAGMPVLVPSLTTLH